MKQNQNEISAGLQTTLQSSLTAHVKFWNLAKISFAEQVQLLYECYQIP